jgi:hypothetical protein
MQLPALGIFVTSSSGSPWAWFDGAHNIGTTMSAIDFDPSNPALVAGERLGVWRLQRHETDVPSGAWWRASHSLGAQAALILVYSRSTDAGAVLLRMAQAEGEPWRHPDVAWPLDSGLTADGRPYVVMPPMEGEPLLAAMQNTSLRRRLDWALQLCELLLLARAKGLALLELDPSLLWVGPQQQLRLHALALVGTQTQALKLGTLEGQVSHSAQPLQCPVAAQGVPGSGHAQVYAVGRLMCLLVNGRLLADEAVEVSTTVQALSHWVSLSRGARAALDTLLRRAVSPEPGERPVDLDELGQAIEAWLAQTGAAAATGAAPLESPASVNAPNPVVKPAPAPEPIALMATAPSTVVTVPSRRKPAEKAPKPSAPKEVKPAPAKPPEPAEPLEPISARALRWAVAAMLAAAVLATAWLAVRGR